MKEKNSDWINKWLEKRSVGFGCGPKETCPDGTQHNYSQWEHAALTGTAVCSKCGHRAIDDAEWL